MKREFLEKLLEHSQEPYAVFTFVSARGHAPQESGAKALINAKGLLAGTIGGGKLEAKAIAHAQSRLGQNSCELLTWNLQKDVGMSCGGEVTLLLECFHAKAWNIAIFGAGHVAQALVRALLPLSCSIQVFDTRADWVERLPTAEKLQAHCVESLPAQVQHLAPDTFIVTMTQGHATDFPVLLEALTKDFPYTGVLGSAIKAQKIRRELQESGILLDKIEKLHCPMGLELGTNAPEEIAISICAQLLQERDRYFFQDSGKR